MKLTKFGKALLLSALSAGVVLSVTSCIQSYSVGYLFVTGTVTAQSNGAGIISGFKINHNTGQLTAVNGLPVASGGANPVRAVLVQAGRFLYVLNRGTTASGGTDLHDGRPVPALEHHAVCGGRQRDSDASGDVLYAGHQSFPVHCRLAGNFLFVLDHDSPNSSNTRIARRHWATTRMASRHDLRRHHGVLDQLDDGRLSLVTDAQATAR